MSELRRKRYRGWIPVALLALPLLYPLSFGPACWMVSRTDLVYVELLNVIYSPVRVIYDHSPNLLRSLLADYANLGRGRYYVLIKEGRIGFWQVR